ncbi:MAG: hemolysin III family protein [Chloroflexi bacterium]|nr:hemolysin III family protein [Chloroflexota bacterium]
MHIKRNELISALTHLTGAVGLAIGAVFLLIACQGRGDMITICLIYTVCGLLMFLASFFYHAQKQQENQNNIWRKLDHIAIFIMIAGSYTALCHIYLPPVTAMWLIIAQWLLVAFGVFYKIFWIKGPRFLSSLIYLLMGWMIIIPLGDLLDSMNALKLWLLISGGLAYTVGAVLYALKKPNFIPSFFAFHEVFHIFVLLGAALHWAVIYIGLSG